MNSTIYDWAARCLLAVIPIILAGLTTIAWNNSQSIGSVLVILEHQQRELDHQRRALDIRCKE